MINKYRQPIGWILFQAALFPGQDPDHYNADGSLRTEHTMPAFKERYDEAKKARWIRTREQRESERELSLNEIFAKEGK